MAKLTKRQRKNIAIKEKIYQLIRLRQLNVLEKKSMCLK